MGTALAFLEAAFQVAKLVSDTKALAQQTLTAIQQPGGVTDADWAALKAIEDQDRARLNVDSV